MVQDKFGVPVTEDRWDKVDGAIKSFIRRHPLQWDMWKKDMYEHRRSFNLAKEGDLKKSGFRNSASFPVIEKRRSLKATYLLNP
jgi:hypothetical protein